MRGYIYVILPFQYPRCIEKFSSTLKPNIAQYPSTSRRKGNEFNVLHQKIKFLQTELYAIFIHVEMSYRLTCLTLK